MNPRSSHFAALALWLSAFVCHAQYHVIPGDADADGCSGTKSARICTGSAGTDHCYAPPSEKLYTFGLEPKAIPAGEINGQPLILFAATFDGCGSGTLTDYSLLAIRNGELVKLSPKIQLTNQSQNQFWDLPQISPFPIFVTADFLWDSKTESHFSHHRYSIRAYVFDPAAGKYLEKAHFETAQKYPGLDDMEKLNVLGPEKTSLISRLKHPQE